MYLIIFCGILQPDVVYAMLERLENLLLVDPNAAKSFADSHGHKIMLNLLSVTWKDDIVLLITKILCKLATSHCIKHLIQLQSLF